MPTTSASTSHGAASLVGVLDELGSMPDQDDGEIVISAIHRAIGQRGFAPLLLVPALVGLSPIGGVPGVPTMLATIMVIVSGQILFGRKRIWLPRWIENRRIRASQLARTVARLRGPARGIDRLFHRRLVRLTDPFFVRVIAATIIALCATMPPLEFVPFAGAVPTGAIVVLALALLVQDGLLVLVGLGFAVASLFGLLDLSWSLA